MRGWYAGLDERWNQRAQSLNERLATAGLPVRVANLSTVWTILYDVPSRYNWMFQFYLRAEGLALSWVGSGRLIFSLNYSEEDFQLVTERFIRAAVAMQQDGWWSQVLVWTTDPSADKSSGRCWGGFERNPRVQSPPGETPNKLERHPTNRPSEQRVPVQWVV